MRRLIGGAVLWAGALGAQVSYTPQPIAFGAVKLGQTSPVLSSVLTNTSAAAFTFCGGAGCAGSVSRMTGSGDFHWDHDTCTNPFAPGATCTLFYTFKPTSLGAKTGSNIVATSVGEFPLNFTGTGLDTVTPPPPPPPPPPSVVAGLGFGIAGVGLRAGESYPLAAIPRDALGQPLGTAVTWAVTDSSRLRVDRPYPTLTQAVSLTSVPRAGRDTLLDTVIATAGGKVARLPVVLLPAFVAPPPPPPVFGIQASWVTTFLGGCLATPGVTCTRGPVPVLADADGHVLAQATVTATFTAP